jgi:hypothetical protein
MVRWFAKREEQHDERDHRRPSRGQTWMKPSEWRRGYGCRPRAQLRKRLVQEREARCRQDVPGSRGALSSQAGRPCRLELAGRPPDRLNFYLSPHTWGQYAENVEFISKFWTNSRSPRIICKPSSAIGLYLPRMLSSRVVEPRLLMRTGAMEASPFPQQMGASPQSYPDAAHEMDRADAG